MKKIGLDDFVLEYKEILEEVSRLKEEQYQQTRFIEQLICWLIKISIQNFEKQNSIELLELVQNFLNESEKIGSQSFIEELAKIDQSLVLNDEEGFPKEDI